MIEYPQVLMYNGLKVVPSIYVSDIEVVERSLKERLFTLPWKPLEKYKEVYSPRMHQFEDEIFVSYRTYADMLKEVK